MTRIPDDFEWGVTTWEGARREQLRRSVALTLRERIQAVEDMVEVVRRLREMRATSKISVTHRASTADPASSGDE
jgi:hypothetical protein